jgi:hypothetical protein
MKHARRHTVLFGMVVLGVLFAGIGCETEPASEKVRVSPDAATIRLGETASFVATGGFDYEWSLSNETLGTLSTRSGPTTVYTSRSDPGGSNTLQQVLTVTSRIGNATTSNAAPSLVKTATSVITHLATPIQTPSQAPEVTVSPSEVTLGPGGSQSFSANGGRTFTWQLSNEAIGTLSRRVGRTTTYTSLFSPGTNVVVQILTVTNEDGDTFEAFIKQL